MPTFRRLLPYRRSNRIPEANSQGNDSINSEEYSNIEVDGSGSGGSGRIFRVDVPNTSRPGEVFQVFAANRIYRVRCPYGVQPGQHIQISLPDEDGSALHQQNATGGTQEMIEYAVTIPPGISPGRRFPVQLGDRHAFATCPTHGRPGMIIRLFINPRGQVGRVQEGVRLDIPDQRNDRPSSSLLNSDPTGQQQRVLPQHIMFEVNVPDGVEPGSHFAVIANGTRVLITCPQEAGPGSKVRFFLPLHSFKDSNDDKKKFPALIFSKDGWTRIVRETDKKFQWIRLDSNGAVDDKSGRFDVNKSAYVCKLNNQCSSSGGVLCWLPASECLVKSNLRGTDGREIFNFSDIVSVQKRTFKEKADWFDAVRHRLRVEWGIGHICINIRRSHLLEDSIQSVMNLPPSDFHKIWRFHFLGERAVDAGGLAREWFDLVTSTIFDPSIGLWKTSTSNQGCLQIQPASAITLSDDDHLIYYRFAGRVLGKALFDGQFVSERMAPYMYKYLLGWPVTFADLQLHDDVYYKSLQHFRSIDDVSILEQTFVVTEDNFGAKKDVELVPGGSKMDVTNNNLPEYLEACLRYRMLGKIEPQLTELLRGFFDVIPEPVLSVFHFQELELLMCGLSEIDLDDWKENTLYTGVVARDGKDHPICQWFWEVVAGFNDETKTQLLLFSTASSGVPSRGFGYLQGNDGNIQKFTIEGVEPRQNPFPTSHTCFNRIDLPIYKSKDELKYNLERAIMESKGFDIE